MKIIGFLIKGFLSIKTRCLKYLGLIHAKSMFSIHNVKYGEKLISNGFAIIQKSKEGKITIGHMFSMNNGISFNQIGHNQPCYLISYKKGSIIIGDNVGISSTAIISFDSITIGNNVKVGGGTVIYDSDFHSINYKERCSIPEDTNNVITKSVLIGDNVFIGSHSIILKGTVIGNNCVIGAGSVVRGVIPENQLWAGNPAKFVRELSS